MPPLAPQAIEKSTAESRIYFSKHFGSINLLARLDLQGASTDHPSWGRFHWTCKPAGKGICYAKPASFSKTHLNRFFPGQNWIKFTSSSFLKEGLKDLFDLSKTNTVCFCYTYATTHLLFIAKLLLSLWAPEIASVSWIWVSNYLRKPSLSAIFWSRENPLAYLTIITFKSGGKRCLFLINSFAPIKCIQHPSNHQCHPPRLPTRERQASNSGFWTCQRLLWFGKFQKNVGVDREPFKMVKFHEIPIDTWHGEDSSLHLSKGKLHHGWPVFLPLRSNDPTINPLRFSEGGLSTSLCWVVGNTKKTL